MAAFLDFLARVFSGAAQQQRDTSAAQSRQQQADRFADAWTRGAISIPSQLSWSVDCPDGTTVPVWPWCTATSTDSTLLLTFTVPPDAPVTADDIARHADAVRLAARNFFGTRLRVTGCDVVQRRCSLAMSPVNPACDGAAFLAGFDDRGAPVWAPLVGQVTAIAGDDGCVEWIASCIAGVVSSVSASPAVAVADARSVGRAARKSGEPPAPLVVALDSAQPGADQLHAEMLGFARRGLVEWDAAQQVETSAWAVLPTQVIMRSGDRYVVERDGRKTPFTPAWLY